MKLQPHQLYPFQMPAEAMCINSMQSPHECVLHPDGQYYPRWMEYAERMAELKMMIDAMRNCGIPI